LTEARQPHAGVRSRSGRLRGWDPGKPHGARRGSGSEASRI